MQENNTRSETVVITGAFSYTGKYATKLLLSRGYEVRTLTNHSGRENPFGDRVKAFPCAFDRPERLTEAFHGASTLINTYWVRFPRGKTTFETAVHNTRTLIAAAKDAGVRRIVHVSIANPSLQSPLGYYRGKAQLEEAVIESGLSYAIVRPTVIFGLEDILINNIAWFVHHFPVFAVPGDGRYGVRPIFVEDIARLLVDAIAREENNVIDAVGPETFTFEELVRLISAKVGRPVRIVRVPTHLAYLCTRLTGLVMRDIVLTWEEYKGLTSSLLAPEGPPTGGTRLSQWLSENREQIGRNYASEVARHYADPSTCRLAHAVGTSQADVKK
jgi:uncharacterized protein YbjT (DUF2867 family)